MTASNKLEIGVRLFGDAAKWADKDYVKDKGPSNVRMDVEIEWIKMTANGTPKIAVFQRNHQRYAHLVANALLRHFNRIAVPLSTRHYLHLSPPHPRDVHASLSCNKSQNWLTSHYRYDGNDQQVSIDFPTDTTHQVIGLPGKDVLSKDWQIAYLSSRLPEVRHYIYNKVQLTTSKPDNCPRSLNTSDHTCFATTTVEYQEILPLTETEIRVAIGRNGASLNTFVSKYHTHYCEILEDNALSELIRNTNRNDLIKKVVSARLNNVPTTLRQCILLGEDSSQSLLLEFIPNGGLTVHQDKMATFYFRFIGTLPRRGIFPFYVARPTRQLAFDFDASKTTDICIHGVYEHQLPPHKPVTQGNSVANEPANHLQYDPSQNEDTHTSDVFPRHARLDILYGLRPQDLPQASAKKASHGVSNYRNIRRRDQRR